MQHPLGYEDQLSLLVWKFLPWRSLVGRSMKWPNISHSLKFKEFLFCLLVDMSPLSKPETLNPHRKNRLPRWVTENDDKENFHSLVLKPIYLLEAYYYIIVHVMEGILHLKYGISSLEEIFSKLATHLTSMRLFYHWIRMEVTGWWDLW